MLIIGIGVLVGWTFDIDWMKRLIPKRTPMNPLTAICFILCAVALLARLDPEASNKLKRLSTLNLVVLFVGINKIGEDLSLWSLPLDQWLFQEKLSLNTIWPNQMAPNTAINFVLFSLALQCLDYRTRRNSWPAQWLLFATSFLSTVALLGYLYQVHELYAVGSFLPMSLPTAIAFLLLSCGAFFARPNFGVLNLLRQSSAAATNARWLTIAVFGLPIVVTWFRVISTRLGWFTADLASALVAVILILCFASLVYYLSLRGHRSELAVSEALRLKQENEARLMAMSENAHDAIVTANERGIIVAWNPAAERILGYRCDEVIGQEFTLIIPAHLHPAHGNAFTQYIDSGSGNVAGKRVELPAIHKSGAEIDIELSLSHWTENQAKFYSAFIRDITERKKSEREVEQANARYQRLVDASLEGIALTSAGRIIDVNDKLAQMFGYGIDEIIGKQASELFAPERQELHQTRVTNRAVGSIESIGLTKLGRRFPLLVSSRELIDGDENLRISVIRDLTEDKARESEHRRLQEIIDLTPDLVGLADTEGNVLYGNQALRQLVGLGDSEQITSYQIKDFHPPNITQYIKRDGLPCAVVHGYWAGETAFLKHDGTVVPTSQMIISHRNVEGTLTHFSTIARDISGRLAAEKQLSERTKDLEQAFDRLNEKENALRAIVETSTDAYICMDGNGYILEWSTRAQTMFGWLGSEVCGLCIDDVLFANVEQKIDHRLLHEFLHAIAIHNEQNRFQLNVRDKKGQTFLVEMSVGAVYSSGQLLHGAFIHDISERKKAESAIKDREERLRLITDNLPAFIAYVDNTLHFRFVNRAYQQWLNLPLDKILNIHVRNVLGETLYLSIYDKIQLTLSGVVATFELQRESEGVTYCFDIQHIPHKGDADTIIGFYVLATDVTDRKARELGLVHQVNHDSLTGLLNRAGLMERLEYKFRAYERNRVPFGVLFLDLNKFKQINDTHGHAVGDQLLIAFGRCLKRLVRTTDDVARLSGDEFILVIDTLKDPEHDLKLIVEKITHALAEPLLKGMVSITAETSMGIAIFEGTDSDPTELIQRADSAMYEAKKNLNDNYAFASKKIVANA